MNIKKKLLLIAVLFVFCLVFVYFNSKQDAKISCKILDVIEADEFYIDINNNNKIDYDEHFKLKNIIALKPLKNKISEFEAKNAGIGINEYLKAGYIARKYAKDNFLNKYIKINKNIPKYDKYKKYREIEVFIDDKNMAFILLESGFAIVKNDVSDIDYLKFQNIKQIKSNSKKSDDKDFLLLNLKNNTAHLLNCEYASKIQNAKLISKNELKNYTPCKICLNKDKINLNKYNIPKNVKTYKTSLYKKIGNIEFFTTNPYLYKTPKNACVTDICKRVLHEINNSKKSIDIAIYGFGFQDEIFNALKRARERGVILRSVVDYSKNADDVYRNTKNFIKEFNPKTDKNTALMHNKFIIFDDSKVFCGSYNLSETGFGGYNLNSGVIINSKELARQYKDEFEQMYEGNFSTKKQKIKNPELKIDSSFVKAYFLPEYNGYIEGIFPLLSSAKEEIFVSAFYLTEKNFINELIKARKKGIKVLVLMDATGAGNFKDRIELLRKENIPVKIENFGGKNHEKTILIDSKILITGSANFSKSGFYKNDENFLIIKNVELAKSYRDFYLYIYNSIDDKYFKFYPRAESFESIGSCNDGIDNDFDGKIDFEDSGCIK